ncbi:unnamed protein product [Oikopleura dioica]|uniref:RING-type domain-containing protein n=1 Tax=Oikopleura dioica TaxID=34765 RepID=E4XMF5_OIKDI|nr:unnamed protein product [Oikopleura dioica]
MSTCEQTESSDVASVTSSPRQTVISGVSSFLSSSDFELNNEIAANTEDSDSISFSDEDSESDVPLPDLIGGCLVKFLNDRKDSNSQNTCTKCNKLYLELFKHYERRVFRRRKKECQRSFCNECRNNLFQETLCKECDANIHDKSFKYQTNAKTLIFTCREDKKCDQILTYEQFIVHKHKPKNFFEKKIENLQQMKMEYKKLAENVEFKKTRILEIDERVKNLKATISDNEDLIAEIYEAIGIAENTVANCETEKRNLKTQIANLKEDAKKLKSSNDRIYKTISVFQDQKQSINDTENRCGVCSDNYDNNHVQRACPPCFHSYCFTCLKSLQEKICPTCRLEFEESDIKKIH